MTVRVSPDTAVVMLVPPAIVNVSAVAFAVVEPESPATVANKFCIDPPSAPVSSAGAQLVPFHFKIWFVVGAAVVVSTSPSASILEYCVRSFA